jgi:hypothetical protein
LQLRPGGRVVDALDPVIAKVTAADADEMHGGIAPDDCTDMSTCGALCRALATFRARWPGVLEET